MHIKRLRTTVFAVLVVAGGALCSGAPALAVTPETPETLAATAVTASTATLHGVLNPNAPGEPGGYQFSYQRSPAECAPEFLAPASPALALGSEKEAVSANLTGLEPGMQYTFCVVATSLSAEPSSGAPMTFTTPSAAPTVDSQTATVGSAAATLEAQVNANNQETTYSFEYATAENAGALAGTIVTLNGESPLGAGFGDQTATVPRIEALTPGTTYYFRVVTENGTGITDGTVQSFTTVPVPHTDAVGAITATTATFNGHLTLNPVDTQYSFDYKVGAECTGEGSTAPADAGTGAGNKAVSTEASELQPGVSYSVCLVASNAFGSEVDQTVPPVHFTTPAAPPKIDGESASGVTPFEATLEAQLNANNQQTTYSFQYATAASGETLEGTITTLAGASALPAAFGDQLASVSTGAVLTPATHYFYRVIAENAAHEKVEGKVEELTTLTAEQPNVDSQGIAGLTAVDATLEAQVNPNYQATTYAFEYATSEAAIGTSAATTLAGASSLPAGFGDQSASVGLASSLQPNTTYFYRVLAKNATGTTFGSTIESFTTLIASSVTTAAAQELTGSSAVLSGTVNAQGVVTSYHYAYIDQAGYEAAISTIGAGYRRVDPTISPYAKGRSTAESSVEPVDSAVHQASPLQIGELTPGATYHYALVATSEQGTVVIGPDVAFTTPVTPPVVVTGGATGIGQTTAVITGGVETNRRLGAYTFELGTSPGSFRPAASGSLSQLSGSQSVTATLTSLVPGTTYYYRLSAQSVEGAATGGEASFTTANVPAQLATGVVEFPLVAGQTPAPATKEAPATAKKSLTRPQKLAKALKACTRIKKTKRAKCVKQAHKKYGPVKKKKKA
jgi:hypothetical protein